VLLLVTLAWAEMTMAPMLAMHSGHMRSGQKKAANVSGPSAHQQRGHTHAAGLLCCPGLRTTETATDSEMISDSLPCADGHRCCFRQGPQSVPAPPSSEEKLAHEMGPASVTTPSPLVVAPNRTLEHGSFALLFPSSPFGVQLRI